MQPVIQSFEIAQLAIRNIRGLRKLDLNLCGPEKPARKLTIIIGKNGTCKSSVLRSIALGLADQTDASKLISEPLGGFISQGEEEGQIDLELVVAGRTAPSILSRTIVYRSEDKEEVRKELHAGKRGPGAAPIPLSLFVCGYGAGRFGTGIDTGRGYRLSDSVATLFRYQETLISTELTLHRLKTLFGTKLYDRVLMGVKRVLGLTEEDEIRLPPGGGVVVDGPTIGRSIALEAWADGYRLTFNWLLDLYAWALRRGGIDEEGHVEGILLIDEIEQHLHPSMQAEILPRLSELLPKMQIFATTHSPLVALDAQPYQLVVLRREGDQVVAQQSVPDFSGYSAEDMLADPRLFDSPVYGEETREKLSEYNELVSIPQAKRSREQVSRLRSLANEVSALGKPEDRETESTRILKQLIAKHGL